MTIDPISLTNSFASKFPLAWDTLRNYCQHGLTSFDYIQDRGGWVATDSSGVEYFFREYRNQVISMICIHSIVVFYDGEAVFCSVPKL